MYVKLNNNLASIGSALIADAPSPVAVPVISSLTLTAAAGTPAVGLAYTPTPTDSASILVIETTGNVTPGKSFVKNLYRRVSQVPDGTPLLPIFLQLFRQFMAIRLPIRKFSVVLFIVEATGQAGIPLSTMCIVAP